MTDTENGGAFYSRVQEKLDSLSKKERETAEYMVANQDKLIYASITELAELVGTSEATVTRVCTKLGYRGFQALKVSVARELVTPQEKIHEDLTQDAPTEQIIDKIFSSAVQTLTMTQRALDSKAVERSIDALCKARRIVIIGNGNSGAIAMDAQHKFLRIGLDAQAYTDDHMQMIAVVSLTPEDVVLAISHSGSSRDVGDAARLARERGATVITITNNGISPVSKLADIRLYTYSQETKYRTYAISSRMAELTIIDTLYTGVSLRLGEQAIGNFEALEKALVVKKY
ncbi:MurR/RpiR family transcriptional regulator [Flavonifractor sp. An92]|uniref:MurR/RpiR family transcriptional regulator n=1 Tax=Flavonifractor sp. An92 TaxID=1965666 RepID=UPI000B38ED69|nr:MULTISPECIES: MurR/RpiR family transcriptional regulator [unclassified Flavonifractor]OUN06139.1 MurR/RpiR family transcriptional regulator [Flavonifractor sp. An92]OUQ22365.1 MurR/RpiR family transcriptional regulator [Flavonifractor sp. An135]